MAREVNVNNLAEVQKDSAWILDFVKITVDPNGSEKIIRLCTHYENITIGSDTYVAAGQLLGFSRISDDLEAKDNTLSVALSGIGNTFTAIVLDNEIMGSLVEVSRGFFDDSTGALVANPDTRWSGLVSSVNIDDDHEATDKDKIVISVECKSLLSTIVGKQYGRNSSDKGISDKSAEFVPSVNGFAPFFGKEN